MLSRVETGTPPVSGRTQRGLLSRVVSLNVESLDSADSGNDTRSRTGNKQPATLRPVDGVAAVPNLSPRRRRIHHRSEAHTTVPMTTESHALYPPRHAH